MSNRFAYDYYEIDLPADLVDSENRDEWLDRMGDHAINEARERASLYVIPAHWTAELIDGDQDSWEVTFKVRRKRHKREITGTNAMKL